VSLAIRISKIYQCVTVAPEFGRAFFFGGDKQSGSVDGALEIVAAWNRIKNAYIIDEAACIQDKV
jgi:hypothetical protein